MRGVVGEVTVVAENLVAGVIGQQRKWREIFSRLFFIAVSHDLQPLPKDRARSAGLSHVLMCFKCLWWGYETNVGFSKVQTNKSDEKYAVITPDLFDPETTFFRGNNS